MAEERPPTDYEHLLGGFRRGEPAATRELSETIYGEVQRMVHGRLAKEGDVSLDTTDVVHEILLRVFRERGWHPHPELRLFYGLVVTTYGRVVADYYRRKRADKRGGPMPRVHLDFDPTSSTPTAIDILTFDELLRDLQEHEPELAEIGGLCAFGRMMRSDLAALLGCTVDVVQKRIAKLRRWLLIRIKAEDGSVGTPVRPK